MNNADEIITIERNALHRWCNGDPSGFLEISAHDVVYFDPTLKRRLDGLESLKKYYEPIRGKIKADRYEMLNPLVQFVGRAAVLTFNFNSHSTNGGEYRWNCTEVYRRTIAGWRIIQTHWSFTKSASA